MPAVELQNRLMEFALRVIRMYAALPERQVVAQVLGKQILRRGTSAGAHSPGKLTARLREIGELKAIFNTIVRKAKQG